MPIKYFILVAIALAEKGSVRAQAIDRIQPDRPDQSESPFTTPKNYLQAELGFSHEHADKKNNSFTYPDVLLKFGLTDKLDLRLITEVTSEKNGAENLSGIKPFAVGFRIVLCAEKGILPQTAFLGELSIPAFSSEKFRTKYYAPAFRFAMQNTLSKHVSLSYNLGAEWDGETPEPAFIYTLSLGFDVTKNISAYTELYGFAPQKHSADHRADAGFTYLINNDTAVDISGGIGITKNAPQTFLAAGFSHRFHTAKKKN